MKAKTLLRDIREERSQRFASVMSNFDEETFNQLLLLELPFKIDIVSLMEMWGEERRREQELKQRSIMSLVEQWIKSARDSDIGKNRRNAINALIKSGVLFVRYDGNEFNAFQFLQHNSDPAFNQRQSLIRYDSPLTKKTYKQAYRNLIKFVSKTLYGHSLKRSKRPKKPLKRAIRGLELYEVATIFNALELEALKGKSDIGMRDLIAFRLILYAGESVDIKDILMLERKGIDFENNLVHIRRTTFECSTTFMRLLKSYLGPRRKMLFAQTVSCDFNQELINKKVSVHGVYKKNNCILIFNML
jgi:hypothetical protein